MSHGEREPLRRFIAGLYNEEDDEEERSGNEELIAQPFSIPSKDKFLVFQ